MELREKTIEFINIFIEHFLEMLIGLSILIYVQKDIVSFNYVVSVGFILALINTLLAYYKLEYSKMLTQFVILATVTALLQKKILTNAIVNANTTNIK
jgi:hypothetical protein